MRLFLLCYTSQRAEEFAAGRDAIRAAGDHAPDPDRGLNGGAARGTEGGASNGWTVTKYSRSR